MATADTEIGIHRSGQLDLYVDGSPVPKWAVLAYDTLTLSDSEGSPATTSLNLLGACMKREVDDRVKFFGFQLPGCGTVYAFGAPTKREGVFWAAALAIAAAEPAQLPVTRECIFEAVERGDVATVRSALKVTARAFVVSLAHDPQNLVFNSLLQHEGSIAQVIAALAAAGCTPLSVAGSGITLLHFVCASGSTSLVNDCLSLIPDVNVVDDGDFTPLYLAVEVLVDPRHSGRSADDYYSVCSALLSAGAKPDVVPHNADRMSCFYTALFHEHWDIAALLLEHGASTSYVALECGATALHLVATGAESWLAREVIQAGADATTATMSFQDPVCVPAVRLTHATPLYLAVVHKNVAMVHALLEASDCAAVDVGDGDGTTPLMAACARDYGRIVRLLYSADADCTAVNKYGWTALMYAAAADALNPLKYLLLGGEGYNYARPSDGWTALHVAVDAESKNAVTMLTQHPSVDVDVADNCGLTPLMLALQAGNAYAARVLIGSRRADVTKTDSYKLTALHHAASCGDPKPVPWLVEAGAQVSVSDVAGATPLHYACRDGHAAFVAALLTAGAATDPVLPCGKSPLALAARAGHLDVVNALLTGGAVVDSRDFRGLTPLTYAYLFHRGEVAAALVAAGADAASARTDANYNPTIGQAVCGAMAFGTIVRV